ncbi:hypothetical protein B0H15DRAFT_864546 [Mycena belliarum]|uniref:Rhodopsin domain-containing protein n=1 Tax=Mycena belliarum TaxID=1033014 RepID=A0AAD6TVI9_9AGAR|nr:hypothetical protein B0H15DRAFT_864546 [Mycena belliae]
MSTTGPTIKQLTIVNAVLLPFACLVTFFRLYLRYARRRLWWDDFWAFVSAMFSFVWIGSLTLHLKDPGTSTIPQNSKIAIYYILAQAFYIVGWTARISILFTVIRLAFGTFRRILSVVAILFFVAWAVLFAQVWWVCERQPGWKDQPLPQCQLGRNVAIAQVITDVLSDAMLIAAPLRLLWRVHLHRGLKFRLLAVFTTSLITTAVGMYHAFTILRIGGFTEAMAGIIEMSTSLLVANLAVIVTFVFSLGAEGDSDNREPLSRPTQTFGSAGTKRARLATTFGGLETTVHAEEPVKVQVHISESDDRWTDPGRSGGWNKSATVVGRGEYEQERIEKLELKAMPPLPQQV